MLIMHEHILIVQSSTFILSIFFGVNVSSLIEFQLHFLLIGKVSIKQLPLSIRGARAPGPLVDIRILKC